MSHQLTEALAKCQEAAGRAPAFVRPYLVPVQDFAAVVVEQLVEKNAAYDQLLKRIEDIEAKRETADDMLEVFLDYALEHGGTIPGEIAVVMDRALRRAGDFIPERIRTKIERMMYSREF